MIRNKNNKKNGIIYAAIKHVSSLRLKYKPTLYIDIHVHRYSFNSTRDQENESPKTIAIEFAQEYQSSVRG